ncbi:hypothetical protein H4582DRAFT_1810422, partial [Lactarius indigo]
PDANIIVRSSDKVDFHVHKSLFAMSSPFFKDLLSLPQPPNDELVDGLPVIQLSEDADLLNSLISLIYPISPIIPSSYEKVFALLAACQKYDMELVQSNIRAGIKNGTYPTPVEAEAFRACAIAGTLGLAPELENAARLTMELPMTFESLGEQLRSFKGRALCDLVRYRKSGNKIMELLAVAQKYQMGSVMTHIRGAIARQDPSFLRPETALHVYFLAQQHELRAYLHELWKYHQQVRTDLKSGVLEFSGLPHDIRVLRCSSSRSGNYSLPQWLDYYIKSIAEAPHLFDLTEFENARGRHIKSEITNIHYYQSFRSSDNVNYRVHKTLLAMSSPFFKDLLSLPQPPDDELVDGLPVIQLSEDADLLNSLISLIYPISPVIPSSYEKVFALLAACQKYDMESVQFDIRAGIKLGTFPAPVEAEAFRACAIAGNLGLAPELEDAARLTLGRPITFESLGEQLRSFKGRALCDLVRYRKRGNNV